MQDPERPKQGQLSHLACPVARPEARGRPERLVLHSILGADPSHLGGVGNKCHQVVDVEWHCTALHLGAREWRESWV